MSRFVHCAVGEPAMFTVPVIVDPNRVSCELFMATNRCPRLLVMLRNPLSAVMGILIEGYARCGSSPGSTRLVNNKFRVVDVERTAGESYAGKVEPPHPGQ